MGLTLPNLPVSTVTALESSCFSGTSLQVSVFEKVDMNWMFDYYDAFGFPSAF
jgi:hypothetical protein